MKHDPIRDVKKPPKPRPRDRMVLEHEREAMLRELGYMDGIPIETHQQQIAVGWLLALETAMRAGEVFGLEWKRVNLSRRFVRLVDTKNGDGRDVPLSALAVELLKAMHGVNAATVDVYSPLFDTSDNGKPISTIENMREILRRISTTVRYNVIAKRIEILIPGAAFSVDNNSNACLAHVLSWVNRFRMSTGNVSDYLLALSDTNPYNPVANWILSQPWDGISRFTDFCGTVKEREVKRLPDGRSLKEAMILRWMVSAVAAAFEPNGISAHGVLVLQGDQNLGKTKWMKMLAPKSLDVIKDGITLNPSDKDSVMLCVSNWIVELGELDATFRKADIASLKSFLTLDRDKLRRPYDRQPSEFARRTVFFASVNPRQFLHDSTGNSRFWTVECTSIDHEHDIDMQQVWAEIYHMYRQGVGWYLDKDEFAALNDHNEDYTSSDPVHDLIDSGYDWQSDPSKWVFRMNATEICLTAGIQRPTKADTNTASSYVVAKHKVKTVTVKGYKQWLMPPKLFKYDNAPPDPAHPGYNDY